MFNIKNSFLLVLLLPLLTTAQQQVLSLQEIIQKIDSNNLLLKTYAQRAEAYKYSADAATAWMPPMVGAGTFMTPYPFQKSMQDRDRGSVMFRIEQEIPNRAKQQANREAISAQGNVENATRNITLNEYKAQAKRQYFNWLVALQKIKVLEKNGRILETMKKIEEVRYPYNQSQLSAVYRSNAEVQKNRSMLLMPQGEIAKAKAYLNALMNRPADEDFTIDTSYEPQFSPAGFYDTASLSATRGDVLRMNESIRSMELNIESMKLSRKPNFKVQFDHMSPLSSMMPKAFTVMGMVSIPIVPWSRKMYQSEIKSMELNIDAMETERSAMLQETRGMLYGMQAEILTMQKRINVIEESVIPALERTFDASYITYQENKLSLTVLISNWEALNMMQFDLLNEKQKLYLMIADYEKELYR